MAVGRFRGGIAAVVWSPDKEKYLLLKRSPSKDFAPGVWEPVTGRLEQGEGFQDALRREIKEEIGATVRIDALLGTTHFYRGARSALTEMIGVVYLCSLDEADSVHLNDEHSEYRWANLAEAKALLAATDPSTQWFRRTLIEADAVRPMLPESLRAYTNRHTSELD